MKTLRVVDETAICHASEIEFAGRAPKVEFRVQIRFEDQDGRDWWIDRVFEAQPKREANPSPKERAE